MALAAIALVSCKKENVDDRTLGSATITGTIRADINQANDLNNAGVYENYYTPDAVEGMVVKVEVNTQNWVEPGQVQGGYDYDRMTYTATTDVNGEFTLTIPATDDGYNVTLQFQDVNGVTRTIFTTDGNTTTEVSRVYWDNANPQQFIYSGANIEVVYDMDIEPTNTDAYEYGEAVVQGRMFGDYLQNSNYNGWAGAAEPMGTGSPLAGKTLYWGYDNGTEPYGVGGGVLYPFMLDADGRFTLNIPTEVASNMNSVDIFFGFADFIAPVTDAGGATVDAEITMGGVYGWTMTMDAGDVVSQPLVIGIFNL